jgi:hypothetical protein
MAQRLSDKTIERLKVRRKPYVVWDSVQIGLGIKITPKGRRIWLQQLKFPGRKVQTKRTLGVFSEAFGVVAARERRSDGTGWPRAGLTQPSRRRRPRRLRRPTV